MPIRRLFEDRSLVVFVHPAPFWEVHYLIVPKRRIPSFMSVDMTEPAESNRILLVLQSAQAVARASGLTAYSLLVNGGAYQDVPQLHFHVASGGRLDGRAMFDEKNMPRIEDGRGRRKGSAMLLEHPEPSRQIHYLITATDATPPMHRIDFFDPVQRQTLTDIVMLAQHMVAGMSLDRFTLLSNVYDEDTTEHLQFHLVSGEYEGRT